MQRMTSIWHPRASRVLKYERIERGPEMPEQNSWGDEEQNDQAAFGVEGSDW
jgi:hypothetical protein